MQFVFGISEIHIHYIEMESQRQMSNLSILRFLPETLKHHFHYLTIPSFVHISTTLRSVVEKMKFAGITLNTKGNEFTTF